MGWERVLREEARTEYDDPMWCVCTYTHACIIHPCMHTCMLPVELFPSAYCCAVFWYNFGIRLLVLEVRPFCLLCALFRTPTVLQFVVDTVFTCKCETTSGFFMCSWNFSLSGNWYYDTFPLRIKAVESVMFIVTFLTIILSWLQNFTY